MLVKFTIMPAKTELYIRADLIVLVERNRQNPLETVITTGMMGVKGPIMYAVRETPDEVARLVASALFDSKKAQGVVLDS